MYPNDPHTAKFCGKGQFEYLGKQLTAWNYSSHRGINVPRVRSTECRIGPKGTVSMPHSTYRAVMPYLTLKTEQSITALEMVPLQKYS